jgi:FkbM family methyltransferase
MAMDPLRPVACVTRRLPRRLGASLGWRIGQRASRIDRVASLRTGGRLVVDIGDYVHRPMYFLGEYEPSTTRLFERLAIPGWTVLDIGANAGYFSVVAATLGAPSARVFAFEPNPRLGNMLSRSISLNPRLDIVLERVAVADQPGKLPLHLTSVSRNSGLSSLRPDLPDTEGEVITVPVVSVDEYCVLHSLRPDLVKIDVEGAELQVLQGASRMLAERQPRWVICEVSHDREDPNVILNLMSSHGYDAYSISEAGALRGLTLDPNVVFENICFIRRD